MGAGPSPGWGLRTVCLCGGCGCPLRSRLRRRLSLDRDSELESLTSREPSSAELGISLPEVDSSEVLLLLTCGEESLESREWRLRLRSPRRSSG
jgi:hypothetical protein